MTRTKGAKDDPSKKRKQRDFAEERRKRNAEKDAEKEKQRPAQAAKNKALLGKMKKGAPTTSSSPRRDAAPTAPNNDELLHLGCSAQCGLSSFPKDDFIALISGDEPPPELNSSPACVVGWKIMYRFDAGPGKHHWRMGMVVQIARAKGRSRLHD